MKNKLCAFSSVLALTGMVGAPVAAAQSSLPGSSFGSSLGSSLGSSWGSSQGSSEGSSAGDDVQPGEGTESRVLWQESFDEVDTPVSYTHLTLPTNREV